MNLRTCDSVSLKKFSDVIILRFQHCPYTNEAGRGNTEGDVAAETQMGKMWNNG